MESFEVRDHELAQFEDHLSQSTPPFLDDMSLVKDNINDVISKLRLSPQILKAAIIAKLQANNNEFVVIICNVLKNYQFLS